LLSLLRHSGSMPVVQVRRQLTVGEIMLHPNSQISKVVD